MFCRFFTIFFISLVSPIFAAIKGLYEFLLGGKKTKINGLATRTRFLKQYL
jgi:hypothetical protein